ncbi:MAG: outer membrane beta-barrel protein [Bradymonadaceae bacterium]
MKCRVLMSVIVLFLAALLLPGEARAADALTDPGEGFWSSERLGVGLRIGGYGFRHVREGTVKFDGCRMNGTGIFATYEFGKHLFGEVSFDIYHAHGQVVENGMERLSLFPKAAIGVRANPIWIFSPYIQAGMGPEWTRIEVDGVVNRTWLGIGFFGLGAEALIDRFAFGTTLRVGIMGDAEHSGDHLEQLEAGHIEHGQAAQTSYQPSAGMLFYGKFRF